MSLKIQQESSVLFQISSFLGENAFKLAACHTYPVSGVEKAIKAAAKKQARVFL